MLDTDYLSIAFEIDIDGEMKRLELDNLSVLPRVGDQVECNYVHGTKVTFEVEEVHHHLANSGHNILQQITVRGRSH